MGMKLTWTNRGIDVLDAIKIYRSTSKTGVLTLVDTIAGTATSYEDNTVLTPNVLYWYSIASVKGTAETLSMRTPIGNFPDTGPGPKNLIFGDWEFGCFGPVVADAGLLPSFGEIATAAPYNRQYPNDLPTIINKWIINGKIIYIPNAMFAYGSLATFVTGKLLKPFGNNAAEVVTIDKGDYGFKIRALKQSNLLDLGDVGSTTGDSTKAKSEIAALVATSPTLDTTASNRYLPNNWRISDVALITSVPSAYVLLSWASATQSFSFNTFASSSVSTAAASSGTALMIGYELQL